MLAFRVARCVSDSAYFTDHKVSTITFPKRKRKNEKKRKEEKGRGDRTKGSIPVNGGQLGSSAVPCVRLIAFTALSTFSNVSHHQRSKQKEQIRRRRRRNNEKRKGKEILIFSHFLFFMSLFFFQDISPIL